MGPILLSLTKCDIWALELFQVTVHKKFGFEQLALSISCLVNKQKQVWPGAYSSCIHKLSSESELLLLYSFTLFSLSFRSCSPFLSLISQLRLCHAAKHVICSELCIMSNYN